MPNDKFTAYTYYFVSYDDMWLMSFMPLLRKPDICHTYNNKMSRKSLFTIKA